MGVFRELFREKWLRDTTGAHCTITKNTSHHLQYIHTDTPTPVSTKLFQSIVGIFILVYRLQRFRTSSPYGITKYSSQLKAIQEVKLKAKTYIEKRKIIKRHTRGRSQVKNINRWCLITETVVKMYIRYKKTKTKENQQKQNKTKAKKPKKTQNNLKKQSHINVNCLVGNFAFLGLNILTIRESNPPSLWSVIY